MNKKVTIIGYGKMGKGIEEELKRLGVEIHLIIDNEEDWNLYWEKFKKTDIAIEFTTPETAVQNYKRCFDAGIPLVTGTTGWYDRLDEVLEMAKKTEASFIYGSNFSIGAQLMFQLTSYFGKLMSQYEQYHCEIHETHHTTKKDAPSGTAVSLAQSLLPELNRLQEWHLAPPLIDNSLPIYSHRVGEAIGEHTVTFSSSIDSLSITHQAHNRSGLVQGAVKALFWLPNHPGIYNFSEIFMSIK